MTKNNRFNSPPFKGCPYDSMVCLNTILAMKKEELNEEELLCAQDYLECYMKFIQIDIDHFKSFAIYYDKEYMNRIYGCDGVEGVEQLYEKSRDKGREFYVYEVRDYNPNVMEL